MKVFLFITALFLAPRSVLEQKIIEELWNFSWNGKLASQSNVHLPCVGGFESDRLQGISDPFEFFGIPICWYNVRTRSLFTLNGYGKNEGEVPLRSFHLLNCCGGTTEHVGTERNPARCWATCCSQRRVQELCQCGAPYRLIQGWLAGLISPGRMN